jgi:hypothetical protein
MERKLRPPQVFVPSKSHHDFSKAKNFGELVFLTQGQINRYDVNYIAQLCTEAMTDARAGDYIMVSSLSVITAVASAIFSARFGRLNLLQYDAGVGDYFSRSIVTRMEEEIVGHSTTVRGP